MITAAYIDETKLDLFVTLEQDDVLEEYSGPLTLTVAIDENNRHYTRLKELNIKFNSNNNIRDTMSTISDRQFAEGLWRRKLISYDDFLKYVGPGVIPPALMQILNKLPDDDTGNPTVKKLAVGLVTGAKEFHYSNPLVDVVRQSLGYTKEQLAAMWTEWAAL